MGCNKTGTSTTPAERLARTREVIDAMFALGKLKAASHHRWGLCVHSGECGRLCPELDVESGRNPTCHGTDLYDALKRRDFQCPNGRF